MPAPRQNSTIAIETRVPGVPSIITANLLNGHRIIALSDQEATFGSIWQIFSQFNSFSALPKIVDIDKQTEQMNGINLT